MWGGGSRVVVSTAAFQFGVHFESCVWRTVSSQSSHHPREVLLAQFSLYVHKGGLKPDSFHFIMLCDTENHKIPRYSYGGQLLGVISLPDDVKPCYVTDHGDGENYVISDPRGHQVVIFSKDGQRKTRYEGEIHGVELWQPYGVITYGRRGILASDLRKHQLLMMWRDGGRWSEAAAPTTIPDVSR